jgi:hypothetical protein
MFTWLVLLLVKLSVGSGKVASGSVIIHENSILKGFQRIDCYIHEWLTSGLCSLWDPVTESNPFSQIFPSLSSDRWNQFWFLLPPFCFGITNRIYKPSHETVFGTSSCWNKSTRLYFTRTALFIS